jgi:hypothetical protein
MSCLYVKLTSNCDVHKISSCSFRSTRTQCFKQNKSSMLFYAFYVISATVRNLGRKFICTYFYGSLRTTLWIRKSICVLKIKCIRFILFLCTVNNTCVLELCVP